MRLFLLIAFFLFCSFVSRTQTNLVLNLSFEDTVSYEWIPLENIPICKDWNDPGARTTDYFSPYCAELGWGICWCAPFSECFGYQDSQDGVAHLGIDIYESTEVTMEYAQGFLLHPLEHGKSYEVSLYDSSQLKEVMRNLKFVIE